MHQKLMKQQKKNKSQFDLKKTAAACGLFFITLIVFWFIRYQTLNAKQQGLTVLSLVSNEYHFTDDEALSVNDGAVLTDGGLPKHIPVVRTSGVPVLMYHHVGSLPKNPDPIRKDLTVSSSDFDSEMDFLQSAGYRSITAGQLQQNFEGKLDLPAKPILITFDDGYADVFENAVPILLKHGLVGSFGIITQFAGNPDYASWQQIADAREKGMEIVSHSQHHIDFTDPRYSRSQKLAELQNSRQDLKEHLGIDTDIFIYPFGHFDQTAEDLAEEAGYKIAFTTKYGLVSSDTDNLKEPRVRVHGRETLKIFEQTLNPAYQAASTTR